MSSPWLPTENWSKHTANGKKASAFDNRLKQTHTLDYNSSFMCSNVLVPEGTVNSSTFMGGSSQVSRRLADAGAAEGNVKFE